MDTWGDKEGVCEEDWEPVDHCERTLSVTEGVELRLPEAVRLKVKEGKEGWSVGEMKGLGVSVQVGTVDGEKVVEGAWDTEGSWVVLPTPLAEVQPETLGDPDTPWETDPVGEGGGLGEGVKDRVSVSVAEGVSWRDREGPPVGETEAVTPKESEGATEGRRVADVREEGVVV